MFKKEVDYEKAYKELLKAFELLLKVTDMEEEAFKELLKAYELLSNRYGRGSF